MKITSAILVSSTMVVAGLAYTAMAQTFDEHKVIAAGDVKWGPAPPSVPPVSICRQWRLPV
jgi:hypothetical protein